MKIALYKSMAYGSTIVSEYREDERPSSGYLRVSEPVEVEFPALADDGSLARQIKALDDEREAIMSANSRRLADIDRRKSELMALTHG